MRKYIVLVAVLALPGCSTAPRTLPPYSLQETGQPALHAIMNDRLRILMAQMNTLLFDQIRTEVELDQERRRNAVRIADAAGKLQQTVDMILAAQPSLQLTQNEAATFAALAGKLKIQAVQLQDLAQRNQIDALPQAVSQVRSTCMCCHSLFSKY